MGIELTNEQVYCIYELENWWNKRDKQLFEISGPAGCGKAIPVDTIIPTPTGEKKFGDLKIGDYVFDRLGKPTKVLGIYDQGKKEVYKITFDDGRTALCSKDHIWSCYTMKNVLKDFTTEELIEHGLRDKDNTCKYAVPVSKAVEYQEKSFKIDPYVIGSFLGNGCCTETALTISSNDLSNVNEIGRLINAIKIKKNSEYNYSYTFYMSENTRFRTNDFFKDVPEMIGSSHEKRIPKEYFLGSISQRWDLIQGLFDIDGSITKDFRKNITYSSCNRLLIEDIKYILHSLGCMCTVRSYTRIKDNKIRNEYEIYAKVPNCIKYKFFRIKRKYDKALSVKDVKKHHNYFKSKIYNIEKMDYSTEMRCIYVDSPDHLYLMNDFIVTHNTTIVKYFIERLNLHLDNVIFVAFSGKAATQLTRSGVSGKTIHSVFYEYEETIERDENGKMIIGDNGKIKLSHKFVLKDHLPKKIKLIVIDEASMVNEEMGKDIMSFNIPIITLGDLNQLPPVFGNPFFLTKPDVELHTIMRQKEGDPIIYLSQMVLHDEPLKFGVFGKSFIIPKSDLTDFHFKNADIVLTGTNKLRYNINCYYREHLKKIKNLEYPHINEKVACRKNNWGMTIGDGIYLTNGMTGFVDYVYKDSFDKRTMKIDFRPDFTKKTFKNIRFDYKHLYAVPGSDDDANRWYYDKIEYAYAISVHMSQGSSWGNTLYLHENFMSNRDDNKRLLYTAITRARDTIGIVL